MNFEIVNIGYIGFASNVIPTIYNALYIYGSALVVLLSVLIIYLAGIYYDMALEEK